MTQNPWEIKGSPSWTALQKAEGLLKRNGGVLLSKYETSSTINDRDMEQKFVFGRPKLPKLKTYMAQIVGEGGDYGLQREWQYGILSASNFKLGDVIEKGWTIPRGNLPGKKYRVYFVVLHGPKESNLFCRFAEKKGKESTSFNPVEREMKYGYRGEYD